MIENNLLSYLNIGLPEDILRMKLHGDFDGAVRLILTSPKNSQASWRFRIRSVTA